MELSLLFSAISVGGLDLKNRLVLPPMATEFAANGHVTDKHVDHYRARTGAGLIIVEHAYVKKDGKASANQLSAATDNLVDDLSRLMCVHEKDSKIALQINHAGSAAKSKVTGCEIVGPSAVMHPGGDSVPLQLSKSDILDLIDAFSQSAVRAERAGFDAVQIHGAHGYLLSQFLSPVTNVRVDEYGGELKRRLQFCVEVCMAVRDAVSIPVLYRLGAADAIEGGLSIDEGCRAARVLGEYVDMLDVSAGVGGFRQLSGDGFLLDWAEAIKMAAAVPVINAGGLGDPVVAEKALVQGRVDLVAVGRAYLEDPNWADKARRILD